LADASVVDQQVHGPQLPLYPCRHLLNGPPIRYICRKGDGASARPFDESHCLGQLLFSSGDHGHSRARPGKGHRYGTPDAPPAAGDNGDLAPWINLPIRVTAAHRVLLTYLRHHALDI
jgi:hypothetical protein